MRDPTLTLPEDVKQLHSLTARRLAEVTVQAILIEKLRHQLAGHRAHRFEALSETAQQLQLALKTLETPDQGSCHRKAGICARPLASVI